jgi:hypothetical protein
MLGGISMTDKTQVSGKKVYQEPDLKVYGDIRKLTGTINSAGMVTDAMFGSSKTQ